MKVVYQNDKYTIFGDFMQTFDKLPAEYYTIQFHEMMGFYITKHNEITVNEKIYGTHLAKVKKTINTFNQFDRNLGVMLSGDKGLGKSLFGKLLSIEAVKQDIPVIFIERYYPGLEGYIETINQECVVFFDEFDKMFAKYTDNDRPSQETLLSLFDGTSGALKKLYIITCNNINNISNYLINRTGRIHYHFRFDYPKSEEITEYLKDHLDEKYYDSIPRLLLLSKKASLNFDSLRSLAFEINNGYSVEDSINDLNITSRDMTYSVEIYFKNMEYPILVDETIRNNFYTGNSTNWSDTIDVYDESYNFLFGIRAMLNKAQMDEDGSYIVDAKYLMCRDVNDENKNKKLAYTEIKYVKFIPRYNVINSLLL